jgi:2-haloacid dehalogenase
MAPLAAGALPLPKALLFDVFGTVVDWRGSIIADVKRRGWKIDAARFADQWRAGYAPAMSRVRSGELGWKKIDELHRLILDQLVAEFRLDLDEATRADVNRVWHRLNPWPDSVAGLTRLKRRFIIAPLSNGNVSLLTNMAKHAGLPWDAILSAELARHYKPDREAYLTAAGLLDCTPAETMMVAAHRGDLNAAGKLGFQTAFIHRLNEYGDPAKADKAKPGEYSYVARDIADLASQLGV